MSPLRTVHAHRPDQLALLGGLMALAVVAWLVTGDRMGSMESMPGMALGDLGFYVTVWVVMTAAMMFPAALFAVGVMSLGWMALIAAFIGAERLLPWPTAARRAVALSLLVLGLGVAFFPAAVPGFAEPDGGMHGGNGPGESMKMMR